ncbi:tRNA (adenine37-N(6))-methyltransferase TrmN6 [Arcticibacter svalbardensis MN12-7]|uniref:tRNA1(Val) (adenine(37)-N6)-methyltransferase n=1 Tax=Arcticibacter svalbardensis MN12-7 TaxID=1150600 RepID=R9GLQ8_9SPHI|nr:methyltransferase [Arcticibacter svalbardensis]EOR92762.1 tRNA (adenine37-N(6))-methyltransferase TrmN6 [Arcticibacter svalbardensis MN12-7]
MKNVFRFKQFSVDQTGCGMKINTDGVLLGALAGSSLSGRVLDIGTGTGVIALMLAQRNHLLEVDAVEIDPSAAERASRNFSDSPFSSRVQLIRGSFQDYSISYPLVSYDLIISNPPFFLKSLKNPDVQKQVARHAAEGFFSELIDFAVAHLNRERGELWLILPEEAYLETCKLASLTGLSLLKRIAVRSFKEDLPHRQVVCFGFINVLGVVGLIVEEALVIYDAPNCYSEVYKTLLRDFLIIF